MDKQRAIRITDDKSWLQSLLNTIYEQRDRALKAEAELRRRYKDIEQLTAECADLKAMLADAGIRNVVLQARLNELIKVIVVEPGRFGKGVTAHKILTWLEREVRL